MEKVKKYNLLKYIKFFWLFFHLAVLWLAAVYASMIVNLGLGLPSSDFNYTVSFFTFICYFPVLLISVALLGMVIYLITWIVFIFRFIFKKQTFFENLSIFNVIGFVIVIFSIDLMHEKIMSNLITNAPIYVRYIAYQTDYQYLSMYLKQFPQNR